MSVMVTRDKPFTRAALPRSPGATMYVFRAVHHICPVYLSSLMIPYTPTRTLRSADQHLLTIPRYHLERYGRRAFSVAGPTLWNALPPAIRQANSVAVFKSLLKTHLFREAFRTLLTF